MIVNGIQDPYGEGAPQLVAKYASTAPEWANELCVT